LALLVVVALVVVQAQAVQPELESLVKVEMVALVQGHMVVVVVVELLSLVQPRRVVLVNQMT
jgi:hypothetical protein